MMYLCRIGRVVNVNLVTFHNDDESRFMRKSTMWVLNRSDTNQAVQAQEMTRVGIFWIWKVEELYNPCSENKESDLLRN